MSGPVQPTGSQNSQNAAVENKSVGQFEDWEVIDKNNACCEVLSEKVRSGFSLGRSIGRAWHIVKEGVSTFFQRFFGKNSKASTGSSGVGVSAVSAKNGEPQPLPNITASGSQPNVPYKNSTVPLQPTVPQAHDFQDEKKQDVAVGSSQPGVVPSPTSNVSGLNTSEVSNKTVPETASTQSTASVKKNVSSSSPKYRLVDVPGDGNCGLYAVLVGMGTIRASEFLASPHKDYGSHPLANEEQKFFVKQLRSGAAGIAKEQLEEKDGSYSKESLETIRRLEEQYQELADDDFKYVAQIVGQPIEVYSQQPGGFARTLFQPNGETTFLFPGDSDPSDKNIIRLYLDGGHYQLMVPD